MVRSWSVVTSHSHSGLVIANPPVVASVSSGLHQEPGSYTPRWRVTAFLPPRPLSTVEPGLASARLGLPLRDFGGRVLRGSWLVAGVGLGPGRWEPLGARLAAHDREAPVGAGLRRQNRQVRPRAPHGGVRHRAAAGDDEAADVSPRWRTEWHEKYCTGRPCAPRWRRERSRCSRFRRRPRKHRFSS